ncbi:MAG: Tad domain-containing protein [Actinomycetota bacterium]|nr:Tad domain-containing protein [Actinomycetota bacterium]
MLKARAQKPRTRARDERGASVVLFSVVLPIILLMGVITVDVGNWWVHKRHLQTQVDAAAFAGGSQFVGCFLNPTDANDEIKTEALKYAGDYLRPITAPSRTNLQVQEPGDVRVALNSARYWASTDGMNPVNGYGLDETADGDPTTPAIDPSDPCSARFLDAKGTDDEAPLLWGLVPFTASPKTHAKVEIKKLQGLSGFLPWAVPEVAPRTVAALFVDETATNTVKSWSFLIGPADPNDTETLNGETAARWTGPASVDVVNRTGMIVLTSRRVLTNADLTGKSLTEMCGLPTASCYGGTTNTSGVEFIRGTPVSDGPVTLNTVELTTLPPPAGIPDPPSTIPCSTTDPDSAPYFLFNAECKVRIRAQIEFGSLPSPRIVRVNGNANCTSGIDLELRDGWWESTWLPTIAQGSRRNGYSLCWRAGSGGGGPKGDWGRQMMQMAYAANPSVTNGSGPMVYSAVRTVASGCSAYANALNTTAQTICVDVGLQPPLRVSDGNAPPIFLRIAGTGSLNQMLDCDASPRGPDEEIATGCVTPHQVNLRDLACAPNPTYTPSNLPLPYPPEPDPWPDCIEANPGDVTSMSKGLRARFEDPPPTGAGCPPNNWVEYRSAGEVPPPEDPRFVTLVVAEYGTFDDSGIKVLPITKFAGFYVTGWFTKNGGQMAQGCPGENDPPPTPPFCGGTNCDPGDQKVQGAVWGYFVTEVKLSPARPSDELCKFDELGTCVAVLVE